MEGRGTVLAVLWLCLLAVAPRVGGQMPGVVRTGPFTVVTTSPSVVSPTPTAEAPAMAPGSGMGEAPGNSTDLGMNASAPSNSTGGVGSVDDDLDAEIMDSVMGGALNDTAGRPPVGRDGDAPVGQAQTQGEPIPADAGGPSPNKNPTFVAIDGSAETNGRPPVNLTMPPTTLVPLPPATPATPTMTTSAQGPASHPSGPGPASPPATPAPMQAQELTLSTGSAAASSPVADPDPAAAGPAAQMLALSTGSAATPSPGLTGPDLAAGPSPALSTAASTRSAFAPSGAPGPRGAASPGRAPAPEQELSIRQAPSPGRFAAAPGAAPAIGNGGLAAAPSAFDGEFDAEFAEGPVALPPGAILVAPAPLSQVQAEDMTVALEVQMAIESGDANEAADLFVETETVTGVADGLRAPPDFTVEAFPVDAPPQERDPDVVAVKGVAIAVLQAVDSDPQIVDRLADAIIESALPKPARRFCTTGDPNRPDWWYAHVGGTRRDWSPSSDAKCLGNVTFNPVGFGQEPCLSGSSRTQCERNLNIAIESCKPILKEIVDMGITTNPKFCGIIANTERFVNRTILLEKLNDRELMTRVQNLDPNEGRSRRLLAHFGGLRSLLVSGGRNVDSLYCARCWPKDVCEEAFAFCKPKPKKAKKCKKGKKGRACRKKQAKKVKKNSG